MAQAAPATCSNATVKGIYVFQSQGSIVGPNGALIPLQITGVEVYDGTGNSHGFSSSTTIINGQTVVQSNVRSPQPSR